VGILRAQCFQDLGRDLDRRGNPLELRRSTADEADMRIWFVDRFLALCEGAIADDTAVITLDPNSDLGWYILGRWYLAFADVGTVKRALARVVYGKLPPTKCEEAVRCFKEAIELNPNRLMHYIELGRTYAQMGRDAEARKFITSHAGLGEDLVDTLGHLNEAADAVKRLADFLERNPNALLTGKKQP